MQDTAISLKGKLLLAMPGLGDPRFYKSVIFICSHDDEGAMGLIINQVFPHMKLGELYEQLGSTRSDLAHAEQTVRIGGPVDTSRGFLLHTSDYRSPETIAVDDRFGVSGTLDALKSYAEGEGPNEMIFMLGYSGWDAGQLDREILDNSWLVIDAAHELIFNTETSECWDRAMLRAGVDPARLSGNAGHA